MVTYAIGYLLGQDFVQKIAGPKWRRIEEKIGQTGIIAVATASLAARRAFYRSQHRFRAPLKCRGAITFIGSFLGLAPGILITNLFAHQFASAIRNPGIGTFPAVAALIVISVVGERLVKAPFPAGKSLIAAPDENLSSKFSTQNKGLVPGFSCSCSLGCAKVRAIDEVPKIELGEPSFFPTIEALTDAPIAGGNKVEILQNGDEPFSCDAARHQKCQVDDHVRPISL